VLQQWAQRSLVRAEVVRHEERLAELIPTIYLALAPSLDRVKKDANLVVCRREFSAGSLPHHGELHKRLMSLAKHKASHLRALR